MVLCLAKNNIANIVGTAGVPPTSLLTYLTGQAYLDSEGAPRDGRRACIVEPFTSATIVDSLKGLFMPQPEDQRSVRERHDGHRLGWYALEDGSERRLRRRLARTLLATLSTNTATFHGFADVWLGIVIVTITISATSAAAPIQQGDVITIADVLRC